MPFVDSSKIAISASRRRPAASPGAGGASRKIRRAPAVRMRQVVDPEGNGTDLVRVKLGRDVDVLDTELTAERISQAAFEVGRMVQHAMRHQTLIRGTNWSATGGGDAKTAAESTIENALDNAAHALRVTRRMEAVVGMVGARFLRGVLIDGQSFTAIAAARGRTASNAGTYAGERFRDLLEDIATEWGAKGKSRSEILSGFAEDAAAVHHEPPMRTARRPIIASQSDVTAPIGPAAVERLADPSLSREDGARAVVRGGIRARA